MANQNKSQINKTLIILILVMLFVFIAFMVFMNIKEKILG